jgi:hypothetical protein
VVLEGRHVALGRPVAIKVLPRALAADPSVRERFVREARIVASLDHPHIVRVHDYVEEDGLCLLIMDLMTGGSLWNRLRNWGVATDQACAIVLAVAGGLQCAHRQGVLHRDIKPGNVLFADRDTVKVADFGIAKVLTESDSQQTSVGTFVGTPAYMAPEQFTGRGLGPGTDLYALGVMTYELLSGRLPFDATTDPTVQLFQHVHEPPQPLRLAAPTIPEPITDPVMHTLEKNPDNRHPSIEAFATALARGATEAFGAGWVQRSGIIVAGADDIIASTQAAAQDAAQPHVSAQSLTIRVTGDHPRLGAAPPTPPQPDTPGLTRDLWTPPEASTPLPTDREPDSEEIEEPEPAEPEPAEPERKEPAEDRPRRRISGRVIGIAAVAAAAVTAATLLAILPNSGSDEASAPTTSSGATTAATVSDTTAAESTAATTAAATTADPTGADTTPATTTTALTEAGGAALPPVVGRDPSDRVMAFYLARTHTAEVDGSWAGWDTDGSNPPDDIASDYYPALGPYSSANPAVLAQHFAWLRQAGVGVIAYEWWGPNSRQDELLPLVLDAAADHGIGVAFLIHRYQGRSVESLAEDIDHLYEHRLHDAFHRTSQPTPYQEAASRGLFLLSEPGDDAADWAPALDEIHATEEGAVVLAEVTSTRLVEDGHFDGLFTHPGRPNDDFTWAATLPEAAWFVPTVMPGYEPARSEEAADRVPRDGGRVYAATWDLAFSTGVEPAMVAVGSFNDWYEGTQIEPASSNPPVIAGLIYQTYDDLGPDGYLDLTAQLAAEFLDTSFPEGVPARLYITSTSDWTTVQFPSEIRVVRVTEVRFEAPAESSWEWGRETSWGPQPSSEDGSTLVTVSQFIEEAERETEEGSTAELVVDLRLLPAEGDTALPDEIELTILAGCYGEVGAAISNLQGPEPVTVARGIQPTQCGGAYRFTLLTADLAAAP